MATEKKPRSGAKRACVCCCGTGCGLLLTFLASIAVLMFVPAIRNALVIFSQSHKLGKVMLLTDTAGALGAMVDKSQSTLEVSNMRMLGAEQNVGVYGVEGVKRGWAFKTDVFGVNRDGVVPQSMSDRTWRELAYDPKLRRHEDLIIVANTSAIPKDERQKAFPGVFPSVIQRSTDDPERVARRLLYVESFPALQENPPAGSVAEFSVPKHVTKDTPQSDGVLDTIVYNVVRQLWGTETDWDMEEVKSIRSHTLESVGKTFLHGDGALAKTLRLFLGDPVVQLHAFREVQAKFEKEKLFPCPAGKAFLEKAKARGLVGEERQREFLAVTIFAGMVPPFYPATPLFVRQRPCLSDNALFVRQRPFLSGNRSAHRSSPTTSSTSSRATQRSTCRCTIPTRRRSCWRRRDSRPPLVG